MDFGDLQRGELGLTAKDDPSVVYTTRGRPILMSDAQWARVRAHRRRVGRVLARREVLAFLRVEGGDNVHG